MDKENSIMAPVGSTMGQWEKIDGKEYIVWYQCNESGEWVEIEKKEYIPK